MEYYLTVKGNNPLLCDNVDESQKYSAEWKKLYIKVHTIWLHYDVLKQSDLLLRGTNRNLKVFEETPVDCVALRQLRMSLLIETTLGYTSELRGGTIDLYLPCGQFSLQLELPIRKASGISWRVQQHHFCDPGKHSGQLELSGLGCLDDKIVLNLLLVGQSRVWLNTNTPSCNMD